MWLISLNKKIRQGCGNESSSFLPYLTYVLDYVLDYVLGMPSEYILSKHYCGWDDAISAMPWPQFGGFARG